MVAVIAISEACFTSIGSECPNQIMFDNEKLTYNQTEKEYTSINDNTSLAQNPADRTWMYKSGKIIIFELILGMTVNDKKCRNSYVK